MQPESLVRSKIKSIALIFEIQKVNQVVKGDEMKKILFLVLMTLCSFSRMVYGDITWSAPVAISTALTDASDPRIVIDTNGNATAVWVENNTIKASSLPFGGSWSAPVTLSNALNTSSSPKLGVDSSGNVTALWIENSLIESATLPFGGSWSVETSPISGTGASNPSLGVDGSGNAVAVWVRSGFIESSTRISGTWSLVSILSAANSDNPHVAISNFGTAIAIWHSVVSGADVIVSDTLTINTNTWAATKNLFSGVAAFFHNYPVVALDNEGNASAAWFRYNLLDGNSYQHVQVLTSSLSAIGAAWSDPEPLSNPGLRNPVDLTIKLKFDASGDTLAVWTNSYDGETFTIESAQRLFGGLWPEAISPNTPTIYSFGIDVALAAGTAVLTNMSWDGISVSIQSQETDTTDPVLQGYTFTNTFSTGNDNGFPQCTMSSTGSALNAAAVWIHFDGSNNVIHAATGADTVIAPPSNVSATQSVINFEVFNDYFNTITWDASPNPNIIQYNIYRNGVFFASTDPGTLQFIDHNAVQGGTVKYGIAALTSAFRQSAIISFTLNP